MGAHGVRLGTGGRLEVVRTAPPEDRNALARTLAALRAAAGAGAVEIVECHDGETLEVVLAYAGRPPVAPVAADEVARIGANVAARLADLHARGIAHGMVATEHVLVDAAGRVSLCGFGASDRADASEDVHALGSLLLGLLDERDRSARADLIRTTAARCRVDDHAARPSMAAVAAVLAAAPMSRRTIVHAARDVPVRRPVVIAAAVAALTLVGAVAFVTVSRSGDASRAAADASTTPTTAPPTTTTSPRPRPTASRVWPDAGPATFTGPGGRWSFGRAGDVVQLGDWDCDGTQTPALVRPDGAVYVIDSWPDTDEAVGRLVDRVPGFLDVVVEEIAGCDVLRLVTTDGVITLELAPGA